MQTPDAILVEIATTEAGLIALRRAHRAAMKNVRRTPIKLRNTAVVNDAIAGLPAAEIMARHGVSYQVMHNVLFQHRQAQRAAVVREAERASGARV